MSKNAFFCFRVGNHLNVQILLSRNDVVIAQAPIFFPSDLEAIQLRFCRALCDFQVARSYCDFKTLRLRFCDLGI